MVLGAKEKFLPVTVNSLTMLVAAGVVELVAGAGKVVKLPVPPVVVLVAIGVVSVVVGASLGPENQNQAPKTNKIIMIIAQTVLLIYKGNC
jgi:hypothetical protein